MIRELFEKFKASSAKSETRQIGDYGEREAARFLRKRKYKIIRRNYVAYGREIDIIAENKEFLVFCEVKTRSTDPSTIKKYGLPRDAVNREKQLHIINAARAYLAKNKTEKRVRFDIVEVYLDKSKKNSISRINHLEDAFRA